MSRCIKMTFVVRRSSEQLFEDIQKYARSSDVEGFVMASTPTTIKMIACGNSENLETFLDRVDDIIARQGGHDVEVDPFLKDKDYRGVFRIML